MLAKRFFRRPDWRDHQRMCIRRSVDVWAASNRGVDLPPVAEPLYPGSLLFNQIAVFGSGAGGDTPPAAPLPLFATLDPVYQTLLCHPVIAGTYLLIDPVNAGHDALSRFHASLDELIARYPKVHQVVICNGHQNRGMVNGIRKLATKHHKKVVRCRVGWRDTERYLSLYRHARHCVFLDSCRVMDAAMTGCDSTLLVSSAFKAQLKTSALARSLNQLPNCSIPDDIDVETSYNYRVVGNYRLELHQYLTALADGTTADCADWLQQAQTFDGQAVVTAGHSMWQMLLKKTTGFKIRNQRKLRKLSEDPHSFLADSRYRVLRALGDRYPGRQQPDACR